MRPSGIRRALGAVGAALWCAVLPTTLLVHALIAVAIGVHHTEVWPLEVWPLGLYAPVAPAVMFVSAVVMAYVMAVSWPSWSSMRRALRQGNRPEGACYLRPSGTRRALGAVGAALWCVVLPTTLFVHVAIAVAIGLQNTEVWPLGLYAPVAPAVMFVSGGVMGYVMVVSWPSWSSMRRALRRRAKQLSLGLVMMGLLLGGWWHLVRPIAAEPPAWPLGLYALVATALLIFVASSTWSGGPPTSGLRRQRTNKNGVLTSGGIRDSRCQKAKTTS